MVKGYLANGLFSLADQMFNEILAQALRKNIGNLDLYVPQEADINDKNSYADSIMIARTDFSQLNESDFIVAVIDGVEVDSGVAVEIGYAYANGIPIFALYSDIRQQGRTNSDKINALIQDGTENQFMYRNLMVIGTIKDSGGGVFSDMNSLISAVNDFVKQCHVSKIKENISIEKLK